MELKAKNSEIFNLMSAEIENKEKDQAIASLNFNINTLKQQFDSVVNNLSAKN
jgi:hypothetical protein